jgi:hypothetical protein
MPDSILAELITGLLRCELSAQQLRLLHAAAPEMDRARSLAAERTATLAGERGGREPEGEEESESPEESPKEQATAEAGLAPQGLETRYSLRGVNSSEPRLCGSQAATAAVLARCQPF